MGLGGYALYASSASALWDNTDGSLGLCIHSQCHQTITHVYPVALVCLPYISHACKCGWCQGLKLPATSHSMISRSDNMLHIHDKRFDTIGKTNG